MKKNSGISLLDVIILILIVGVIAALLIPKARLEKEEQSMIKCRERMLMISDAEMEFFATRGDTTELNPDLKETSEDTLELTEENEDVDSEEEVEERPHLFTDDLELLKPYLPDSVELVCPLDGKEYIIIAKDSVFYSISCPNGHGQVIKGRETWED